MATPSTRQVFRSTLNKIIAATLWALVALVAVSLVTASVVRQRPTDLAALLLMAAAVPLIWELLWRPHVIVDDESVAFVNIFRTIEIPWTAVIDIDTKWALTVVTPHGRYRAATAPAPGALSRARYRSEALHPTARSYADGGISKSEAIGTDSGDGAAILRTRWQQLLDAGRIEIGRADTDRARIRVHALSLVVCVVLAVAAVLTGIIV